MLLRIVHAANRAGLTFRQATLTVRGRGQVRGINDEAPQELLVRTTAAIFTRRNTNAATSMLQQRKFSVCLRWLPRKTLC
jgi:hypothetical protein